MILTIIVEAVEEDLESIKNLEDPQNLESIEKPEDIKHTYN